MGASLSGPSARVDNEARGRAHGPATSSTSRPRAAAAPAPRAGPRDATRPLEIVSWTAPAAGRYELRARLLTAGVRCRARALRAAASTSHQPTLAESIPTPGDAAGSLTVGAFDWRDGRSRLLVAGPDARRPPQARAARAGLDDGLARPRDGRHLGLRAARRGCRGAADPARPRGRAAQRPRDDHGGSSRRARSTTARPGPDNESGYGKLRPRPDAARRACELAGRGRERRRHHPAPRLQVIEDGTIDNETYRARRAAARQPGTSQAAHRHPAPAGRPARARCLGRRHGRQRAAARAAVRRRQHGADGRRRGERRRAPHRGRREPAVAVRDAGLGARLGGRAPSVGRRERAPLATGACHWCSWAGSPPSTCAVRGVCHVQAFDAAGNASRAVTAATAGAMSAADPTRRLRRALAREPAPARRRPRCLLRERPRRLSARCTPRARA